MSSTSEHGREKHDAAFKAAQVSVLLNAALMTMQIAVGWLAYSDGLLADGVHTLADLAADGMVLAVLRLSATAAHRSVNDQYDRYETIGSLTDLLPLDRNGNGNPVEQSRTRGQCTRMLPAFTRARWSSRCL